MKNIITIVVLIILFSLSIGLYQVFKYKPDYSYIVTKEPIQENIINKIENFKKDDFIVVPLKNYEIEARILSKKKYTIGEDSDLATYDLALGWKEMSDIHYLEKIKISQRNRWYYWRTKDRSIPREIISYNSSNHHIVHANEKIKKQLSNITKYEAGISKLANIKKVIKLSSNEGAFGPSLKALKTFKKFNNQIFRYPDPEVNKLRNAISKRYKLNKNNIIYLVWFKNDLKKNAVWIEKKELLRTGSEDSIKEFEKQIKIREIEALER